MTSFQDDLHPPCLPPEGAGSRWCHVTGTTCKLYFIIRILYLSCPLTQVQKAALLPLTFFVVSRKWQWYTSATIVAGGAKWVFKIWVTNFLWSENRLISVFFFSSASTVSAESVCPICQVVYPADIIEMHASACNDRYVVIFISFDSMCN